LGRREILKLDGSSARTKNFPYIYEHEEDTLSSNLLWHARYGQINYDSLTMLKKSGFFGFPAIPKDLKQCDAYILGIHSKQPFL